MQKAQSDIQKSSALNGTGEEASTNSYAGNVVIHEDGTVRPDDNVSTRAMISPSSTAGDLIADEGAVPIPIIRVSTESDRATRATTLVDHPNENSLENLSESNPESETVEHQENGTQHDEVKGLEKPVQAAASEEKKGVSDAPPSPSQEPFSFSNKRLCERWLDNLFMVLYEVTPLPFMEDLVR